MIRRFQRFVASLLVVCLTGVSLPLQAGMLPTEAALANGERERIASFLDRQDVRGQLETYGVSQADLKARVAALTDEEARQLAGQIENLPAGGADVLGVLLVVFLVLLITDILGFTKIFPFTRSVR